MWTEWLCGQVCPSGKPSQAQCGLDRPAAAHNPCAFLRAITRTAPWQERFAERRSSVRSAPPVAEGQAQRAGRNFPSPAMFSMQIERLGDGLAPDLTLSGQAAAEQFELLETGYLARLVERRGLLQARGLA